MYLYMDVILYPYWKKEQVTGIHVDLIETTDIM